MAPVLEPVRLVGRLIARDQARGFPPDRWTVDTEAPLATPSRPLVQTAASDESSNPRAKERT